MIQEFSVKNFFSIKKEQKISFVPTADNAHAARYLHEVTPGVKLLKLGIVYGANASGKSTVLMALDFFHDLMLNAPQDRMSKIDGYAPFLLDDTSRDETCTMNLVFWIAGERYVHDIEFDARRIYGESLVFYGSRRPSVIYERSYDKDTDHSRIVFGPNSGIAKKSQDVIEGNALNNCSVMAAFGKSNVEESRLNRVYEFYARGVDDLLSPNQMMPSYVKEQIHMDKDGKLKAFLLNMLHASDFNIVDFDLKKEELPITPGIEMVIRNTPMSEEARADMLKKGTLTNEEISFRHMAGDGRKYDLPEIMESRGTIRFLGMGVILHKLLSGERFMIMDEVEASLHYELLSYFLKVFLVNSDNGSQMLIATHDVNLLDEDFIRRDVVWFTDKNENGETEVKRLTQYGLHKTLSPYNAYKQGKLGKLPFVGSIFL